MLQSALEMGVEQPLTGFLHHMLLCRPVGSLAVSQSWHRPTPLRDSAEEASWSLASRLELPDFSVRRKTSFAGACVGPYSLQAEVTSAHTALSYSNTIRKVRENTHPRPRSLLSGAFGNAYRVPKGHDTSTQPDAAPAAQVHLDWSFSANTRCESPLSAPQNVFLLPTGRVAGGWRGGGHRTGAPPSRCRRS